jgi:hypothetical protein
VPLNKGDVCIVLNECPTGASTKDHTFTVQSDGVLLTLFVESISGLVDVNVYTLTKTGHEKLIDTFPQISAPTTEVLIRKEVQVHDQLRVEVITTDAAKYDIRAKGIDAGVSSVKITGSENWEVDKVTVGTGNTLIIAADLDDRSGMAIRNGDFDKPLNTLYVAESEAKLDAGKGYPILPGEALQIDIKAGNEVWGFFDNTSGPVHNIQTGG